MNLISKEKLTEFKKHVEKVKDLVYKRVCLIVKYSIKSPKRFLINCTFNDFDFYCDKEHITISCTGQWGEYFSDCVPWFVWENPEEEIVIKWRKKVLEEERQFAERQKEKREQQQKELYEKLKKIYEDK